MNFDEYDDEIKDCMFQYATTRKIIENTDLITRREAEILYAKYLPDIMKRWNQVERPEIVIWVDCVDNATYRDNVKYLDYQNTILENGHFYKVKKELIV